MKWNKTLISLPPVTAKTYGVSEINYLLLIPEGHGWDKVIANPCWHIDENGMTYLSHWRSVSGDRIDTYSPIYWLEIKMPDDSTEVLSDWQDEKYDSMITEVN